MYGEPDKAGLRQGDVITDICFPRYSLATLRLIHLLDQEGAPQFSDEAQLTAKMGMGVVVTQCCEFTASKRNAFTLALLEPIRDAISLTGLTKLREWGLTIAELVPLAKSSYRGKEGITAAITQMLHDANDIDPDSDRMEAVNVYYLKPDGVHLTEPHLVDFTRVISIRMADQATFLKSKVLQLDDEHRRQFQLKLAYYYGRRAE